MQLKQELSLKLAMTPELRQSIQLLQYSALDLLEWIQQQGLENPFLEIDYPSEIMESYSYQKYEPHNGWNVSDLIASSGMTLEQHLLQQLSFLTLEKEMNDICKYIIGNIDTNGYLSGLDTTHCETLKITEENKWLQALEIVQTLEPVGVGARSLQECLQLQIREKEGEQSLAYQIVSEHLELLASKQFQTLASLYHVPPSYIESSVRTIHSLNPRPGICFEHSRIDYIVPDVIVYRIGENYAVSINHKIFPRVRINDDIVSITKQGYDHGTSSYHTFVKEKISDARMLLKALDQRRKTMTIVTEAIVNIQTEFLTKGERYLKPLTLKQIAEMVDLHESTISRATQHKYVQPPQGVFEFKRFFVSGLTTD